MELFKINSPSPRSGSDTDVCFQETNSRHGHYKSQKKLCLLSQLPLQASKEDLLEDSPIRRRPRHDPPPTPPTPLLSRSPFRTVNHIRDKAGGFHRTPSITPVPAAALVETLSRPFQSKFSGHAYDAHLLGQELATAKDDADAVQNAEDRLPPSSTMFGALISKNRHTPPSFANFSEDYVTPDAFDTAVPDWAMDETRDEKVQDLSSGSIKDRFSISKFQPNFSSPSCFSPFPKAPADGMGGTPAAGFQSLGSSLHKERQRRISADRQRRGSATSVTSVPGREPTDKGQELTPSTAKVKILPSRPKKGGCRLRRQRSLRMHGGTFPAVCSQAENRIKERNFPSQAKLKRRNTFAGLPNTLGEQGCPDAFIKKLVSYMKLNGITMIALDWDQTLLRCHTKSNWYGTADELQMHIRPKLRKLVLCAHKQGIRISIVTFSEQVELVRQVLRVAFPAVPNIIVRGNGPEANWALAKGNINIPEKLRTVGKVPHLMSALEAVPCCMAQTNTHLRHQSVVLIDDDLNNIKKAMEAKFSAFWMNVDSPDEVWFSMQLMFNEKTSQ